MAGLSANSNQQRTNLSENPKDFHGKKAGFNLPNYFQKKWNLREIHRKSLIRNNAKESSKWKFQNCCLLTLDENVKVKPNELFSILKTSLAESLENIVAIGQFASSKMWTIQFKDRTSFESNLGKEIQIIDVKHSLEDANQIEKKEKKKTENKYTMSVFIRVHWLPSGFKNNLIKFLKEEAKFLTILDIKSETWEEGQSSIENGVYSVKVSYDIDAHANFLNFAGYHRIEGLGALVNINGMPSKCLQCNKWGHTRKECPDKDKMCSSCNKPGHEAANCWSSQAKNNNNNNNNNNDNIEMELVDSVSQDGIPQEEIVVIGEEDANLANDKFKAPSIPISLEVKKEIIEQLKDHMQESIESVIKESTSDNFSINPSRSRTLSCSSDTSNQTALFTKATFDKIIKSNNPNNKTAKSKADQKKLKDEEKRKETSTEFANMNVAALLASKKQIKRQNSMSNTTSENKKSFTCTFTTDTEDNLD